MPAIEQARALLARGPCSKIGLRRALRNEGIAEQDIQSALDILSAEGISWNRECLRNAELYCRREPACSRQDLRRELGSQSFLPAEVGYAEKTLPVNWFDHAQAAYAKAARPGMDPMAQTDALRSGGFTPAEISYAIGEVPDSLEEQALERAAYLLGAAPSSEQSVRTELRNDFEAWVVVNALDRLGDIWTDQALAASWRLLGRYGPALSQQRLGSYLRIQNFTLHQIASVYQEFPVDWDAQAVACARYYYFHKGVELPRLKDAIRQHKFTAGQAKAAVRILKDGTPA